MTAAEAAALTALRQGRYRTAERQARALPTDGAGGVVRLALLGAALLGQDQPESAIEVLETAVAGTVRVIGFPSARTVLARAYRQAGRLEEARGAVREALKEEPAAAAAWLAYGDVLVDLRQYGEARAAFERARLLDVHRPAIDAATSAMLAEDRKTSEQIFRRILDEDASHPAALCGLAALSLQVGRTGDAERLVRHALKQSPHLPLAQRALGHALLAAGRLPEAEAALRKLLEVEPENPQNWISLGTLCTRLLRQQDALEAFEQAARLTPRHIRLRLSIGHVLKTLGRREQCEAAYHACLELDPTFSEAYWSLADLKNYTFSEPEIAAMQALAAQPEASPGRDAQLFFALGRALEQRARYDEAFEHYCLGNALRRRDAPFDIGKFERKSARVIACFDRPFFDRRQASGCPDPAPIFIVGLPRSGSTLIEQILASHSSVEGTMELPNLLTLVREFDHAAPDQDGYPERVAEAGMRELTELGARYLRETRPLRTGKARFIDKMPNNFSHIGLIQLILPNASIIDVRRHPLDACFSAFKQHFAEGQAFSYDLADLGRYYRCYLALMDHWERVLPGRVLQVRYEEVVRSPEASIRRLLAHCGLPYESACLDFHETRRPVRTASSEQVRQPLYASGIGYWRHFERQLAPLRAALGDCLARFEDFAGTGAAATGSVERSINAADAPGD